MTEGEDDGEAVPDAEEDADALGEPELLALVGLSGEADELVSAVPVPLADR